MQFKSIAFMALAAASSVAAQNAQQPIASAAPAATAIATDAAAPTVALTDLPPLVGTIPRNPRKKFGPPGRPIQKDIGSGQLFPPLPSTSASLPSSGADDDFLLPPPPTGGKGMGGFKSKEEKLKNEIKDDIEDDIDDADDDIIDEKRGGHGGHGRGHRGGHVGHGGHGGSSDAVGLERNFGLMMVAGGLAAVAVGYM